MFAANRSERREEILDMLEEGFKTENIVDYTSDGFLGRNGKLTPR
jgi:hypothetical protein